MRDRRQPKVTQKQMLAEYMAWHLNQIEGFTIKEVKGANDGRRWFAVQPDGAKGRWTGIWRIDDQMMIELGMRCITSPPRLEYVDAVGLNEE